MIDKALEALKAIVNGMPDEVIDNASDPATARLIQSLLDKGKEAIKEIEGAPSNLITNR